MNSILKNKNYFQNHPILASILIANIISILFFIFFNVMIAIPGDLDLFLGTLFGIFIFEKIRPNDENPLVGEIFVGSMSAFLSTISFSIIAFIISPPPQSFIISILPLLFVGQFIGLLLGGGLGLFYKNRQDRRS
jgi:hypothetical protein